MSQHTEHGRNKKIKDPLSICRNIESQFFCVERSGQLLNINKFHSGNMLISERHVYAAQKATNPRKIEKTILKGNADVET